jgi:hypothetical protein
MKKSVIIEKLLTPAAVVNVCQRQSLILSHPEGAEVKKKVTLRETLHTPSLAYHRDSAYAESCVSPPPPPSMQGMVPAATSKRVWKCGLCATASAWTRCRASGGTRAAKRIRSGLTPCSWGASVCVRECACLFLDVIRVSPLVCSHHVSTVMCTIGSEMLQPLPDRSSPSVQPAA